MFGRARVLAFAFAAALALPTAPAGAANWLEMDFYMSGPEYEGKLPPCDYRDALVRIASRFNQKENMYWATRRPFHAATAAASSRSRTAAGTSSIIPSSRMPA